MDSGLPYGRLLMEGGKHPGPAGSGHLRPLPEGTVAGDRTMAPSVHVPGCQQLVLVHCLLPSDLEEWAGGPVTPARRQLLPSELTLPSCSVTPLYCHVAFSAPGAEVRAGGID